MSDTQPAEATEHEGEAFEQVDSASLLPGADALNPREASRLLARRPGRVVVWAGERDSGKTTLTCELYERQRSPGSNLRFAGSETLLGLERLAHPSRASSGRTVRETRRTERDPDGRELLHLALALPASEPLELLLADMPGEVFRQLRDNEMSAKELPLLQRADKLALIADGSRLIQAETRSNVVTGIRQLMHATAAAGALDERTELALVVTKWDLIVDDQDCVAYWTMREQQLAEEMRELDAAAPVFRVAAQAPADWQHGDGMGALTAWIMGGLRVAKEPAIVEPRHLSRLRQPKRLVRS